STSSSTAIVRGTREWDSHFSSLSSYSNSIRLTVAQHLFGIENIVVVHHTHCGATSFTADGIIDAFKREQGVDIVDLYERDSIGISDYVKSLQHDTRLLREAKGTPKPVNVYGYLYDIDTDELTRVTEDIAPDRSHQLRERVPATVP